MRLHVCFASALYKCLVGLPIVGIGCQNTALRTCEVYYCSFFCLTDLTCLTLHVACGRCLFSRSRRASQRSCWAMAAMVSANPRQAH